MCLCFLLFTAKVDLPEEIFQKLNIRKYTAQSVDPIFRHIRDSHLSVASSNLKKIAMELRGNSPSSKDMTISEMKEFVQKELKNRKALQLSLRLRKCKNNLIKLFVFINFILVSTRYNLMRGDYGEKKRN